VFFVVNRLSSDTSSNHPGGSLPFQILPIKFKVHASHDYDVTQENTLMKSLYSILLSVVLSGSTMAYASPSPSSHSNLSVSTTTVASLPQTEHININEANAETLSSVKGLGTKKAQAIVAYRETHGAFQSLSDLKKVHGIGDKLFNKIVPYLTCDLVPNLTKKSA
jgi:comEA protein